MEGGSRVRRGASGERVVWRRNIGGGLGRARAQRVVAHGLMRRVQGDISTPNSTANHRGDGKNAHSVHTADRSSRR